MSSRAGWRITILTRDGQRVIFHARCDDLKEIQALATEARSADPSTRIWIKPPAGPVYPWD